MPESALAPGFRRVEALALISFMRFPREGDQLPFPCQRRKHPLCMYWLNDRRYCFTALFAANGGGSIKPRRRIASISPARA